MKMYRVPPDRAWWPAVGAPLERVVRPGTKELLHKEAKAAVADPCATIVEARRFS